MQPPQSPRRTREDLLASLANADPRNLYARLDDSLLLAIAYLAAQVSASPEDDPDGFASYAFAIHDELRRARYAPRDPKAAHWPDA